MRVGIPKGLLYYKYRPFFEKFFEELISTIFTNININTENIKEYKSGENANQQVKLSGVG